ncbi:MAG: hypothetical protein BGO80_05655 [Devosia sp. 63-57]|nr:MAG: hypothetical protein ABS74_05860 [Pelagibacterium sp. SCN 63-126]OJX45306.1 MAG: hypothetical protein BGO80_05655 [Devosia sp. 63-57]
MPEDRFMADIINLRQVRKQKARSDKENVAAQNRVLHGRTKAEKQREATERQRAERLIDGHKREE